VPFHKLQPFETADYIAEENERKRTAAARRLARNASMRKQGNPHREARKGHQRNGAEVIAA
jgi:hypothetical protein